MLDLWRLLANAGPKAAAEALTALELSRLHVPTPLDGFILDHVRNGWSVVLTGNAGDGKTHLLEHSKSALRDAGALLIEDATASMRKGDTAPVLDAWRAAASQGRPVCLAANEYPLYELRRAGGELAAVREVDRQCRRRLAYGPELPEEHAQERVLVIDLSLRNPSPPVSWSQHSIAYSTT